MEGYVLNVFLSELGNHLLELFLGVAPVCQGLLQVVPRDLPVPVCIKVLESLKKDFFACDEFLVTGGDHELLKLDLPVLVVINDPEYLLYLEVV